MDWKRIEDNDIKTYNAYNTELELLIERCIENGEEETENINFKTLELLIKNYDDRHRLITGEPLTAPQLIKIAMLSRKIKRNIELAELLGVGESLISQVLNYKKAVSKKLAIGLAKEFDFEMEDLLREYPLEGKQVEKAASIFDIKRAQLIQQKKDILAKIKRMDTAVHGIDEILKDMAV